MEKFLEKSKQLLKKSLHNLTDFDNSSNNRRGTSEKSRGNTAVHRFLQGIKFHKQMEDRLYSTLSKEK